MFNDCYQYRAFFVFLCGWLSLLLWCEDFMIDNSPLLFVCTSSMIWPTFSLSILLPVYSSSSLFLLPHPISFPSSSFLIFHVTHHTPFSPSPLICHPFLLLSAWRCCVHVRGEREGEGYCGRYDFAVRTARITRTTGTSHSIPSHLFLSCVLSFPVLTILVLFTSVFFLYPSSSIRPHFFAVEYLWLDVLLRADYFLVCTSEWLGVDYISFV